jgi:hypothetical protein
MKGNRFQNFFLSCIFLLSIFPSFNNRSYIVNSLAKDQGKNPEKTKQVPIGFPICSPSPQCVSNVLNLLPKLSDVFNPKKNKK